ncbi:MAG: glycosyltransferase family 4 protein [Chloroflexi bacterium]|nr:glycosyltransferase family 4 protein [Chloroflexota bacterium]
MKTPIRLLLVTKSTGGVATYIRALVGGLDKTRFVITVACLSENGPEFAAELTQRYGVRAFSLAMNRYKINPLTDARVLFQLAGRIRREKYDVIHAHASKPGFLARMAAIGTGIPVIYSPHNFAFHEGSKKLPALVFALLEKIAVPFTAKIVAVARHERDLALKYGVGSPDLYTVIHTGIDAAPFRVALDVPKLKASLGIPAESQVVGAVGRLAIPKLPLDFVRAADEIHKSDPSIRFVWAGSGPLEAEAKALTSSLGLDGVFHWLGHRSDVSALYRIFDCFVLPSQWEAYPYVILEAFAAGVPVVATSNLGALEIIEDEVNGILVPVNDVPALAVAIKSALGDPLRIKALRAAASKQIDEIYTMQNMLRALEEVYLRARGD